MAFKKTICEDIWLVFMTINAQVCFILPKCGIFSPPPILEVAQLRHQGIGIDAPGCNTKQIWGHMKISMYPKSVVVRNCVRPS